MRGWFKVNRDIIKRAIFSDAELLRLYIYLKADANIEAEEVLIDGQAVILERGQGTYGRHQLSAALNVNPSTLYKRIKKLEKLGFIKLQPHKEMSVYTVTDYDLDEERKVTTKCQPSAQQNQGVTDLGENESNSNVNKLGTNSNTGGNTLKEVRSKNKKEDINIYSSIPYEEIISHLNQIAGTNYRHTTKSTKEHINGRWRDGFKLPDFKTVIDKKCTEWLGTDQAKYLRPETLFGTKFEGYLNQPLKGGQHGGSRCNTQTNESKPKGKYDHLYIK